LGEAWEGAQGWSLKWMETSMIYNRKKMPPPCPTDIPPFSQVKFRC